MIGIIKRTSNLFIIFCTFATWFAISGWLRLPVVIVLTLTFISTPLIFRTLIKKPSLIFEDKEDILMLGFLVSIGAAFLFGYFNQRSFNHTLSYFFSILFFYIFFKIIIKGAKIEFKTIIKYVAISVIINNIIIIAEWILINNFNIAIRPYFLTGGEATTNMTFYYHSFFKSVAGTGEEPGGTASLLNIFFPIGLIYFVKHKSSGAVAVYIILHFLGLVFLASAAGVFFLAISYLAVSIYYNLFKFKSFFKYVSLNLLLIAIFIILYQSNFASIEKFTDKYYAYIEEKITLSNSNISASTRKSMWKAAVSDWLENPVFGKGPGYGVEKYSSGYFNTFLTILADAGFISFLLFNLFFIIVLFKILKLDRFHKFYLLFSFLCLMLHSSIYYVYYHEPFWLPIILVQLLYKQRLNASIQPDLKIKESIIME